MLDNILAGPILRRTTAKRICVWLALDKNLDVTLEILDAEAISALEKQGQATEEQIAPHILGNGSSTDKYRCCQLGDNLFIYMLQALPVKDEFPVGKPLYYRLKYADKSADKAEVKVVDLSGDKDHDGLTYPNHNHPIFHVPGKLNALLHGSCRKPHGVQKASVKPEGNPLSRALDALHTILYGQTVLASCANIDADSLTAGDDLLREFYKADANPTVLRNQDLLLLTGDQIYADDVAVSLAALLRDKAVELTGTNGALPLIESREPALAQSLAAAAGEVKNFYNSAHALTPGSIPLCGRSAVLKNKESPSGFTSSEAYNHLLSFGEFAAMYLFAFGNAKRWTVAGNWASLAAAEGIDQKGQDALLTGLFTGQDKLLCFFGIKDTQALQTEKLVKLKNDIEAVDAFQKSLPQVRRLLANMPTYMIFDDHDVTDDWNITGHWYEQVRESPLGRRIVANALAAYWAFQGWGNDPDNFDDEMVESIVRHLNKTVPDAEADEQYDFLTWRHRGWGYSVPTQPPIIAMDSRTQRQPDNPYFPARLMDRYALDWLKREWDYLKIRLAPIAPITPATCPVLIAATPVFGFSPLERLVGILIYAASYFEDIWFVRLWEKLFEKNGLIAGWLVDYADAEAWSANKTGYYNFLDTLLHKMQLRQCVFLSGDVHYAFSALGRYQSNYGSSNANVLLSGWQLTCSSLRNESSKNQKKALRSLQRIEAHKTIRRKIKQWLMGLPLFGGFLRFPVEHDLVPVTGKAQFIVGECNLGEVVFDNQGLPFLHVLRGPNISILAAYDLQNPTQVVHDAFIRRLAGKIKSQSQSALNAAYGAIQLVKSAVNNPQQLLGTVRNRCSPMTGRIMSRLQAEWNSILAAIKHRQALPRIVREAGEN